MTSIGKSESGVLESDVRLFLLTPGEKLSDSFVIQLPFGPQFPHLRV